MDEMHYQLELLKAMNEKLMGNDKMFRMLCGTSSNAFLFYTFSDDRFETLGCWDQYFDFQVQNRADLQNILSCVKDKYYSSLEAALFCERTKKTSQVVECELMSELKWLEFDVTISYDSQLQPSEKIIRIRDITKNKLQTEELKYMAYYDALTGLFNRNYYVRNLSEWVRRAEESHDKIAILCIRLDEFRKINDSRGMIAGDEFAQLFGLFLKEFETENLIISHFYEDIYYIALYNPYGNYHVDTLYHKICTRMDEPFYLTTSGMHEIKSTISIGVAEYPDSGKNPLELINCAEIVMNQTRENGRNNIAYFEAPIYTDFMEHIHLEDELKQAITENNFELYYQPQYDSNTKHLRGVEALIRWKNHDGSFISPSVFIPIAEKDGLIIQIGNWVLEEGLRAYQKWYQKYHYPMVLSLNISAIQYNRKDFVHKLLSLIEKYNINPELIELEITETVLIDDFESVVDKLHTLKEYGIKISLDDFGTGFSSLSYLKGLPIDTLKIDKTFIDTVIDDNPTRVITESIINMVKKLGCETVAEGVETQEQYEYLKTINCDSIQGFLLGKPMPASEIDKLLASL